MFTKSFNKPRRRALLFLGLMMIWSFAPTNAMDLGTIIEGTEFRESKIHDIRVKIESWFGQKTLHGADLPQDTPQGIQEERFANSFSQRYVRSDHIGVSFEGKLMNVSTSWATAGDGKLFGFNYSSNSGHITSLTGNDATAYHLLFFTGWVCEKNFLKSLPDVLRIVEKKRLNDEVEKVNGFDAYRIDYVLERPGRSRPSTYKIWICPSNDFLPVRIELWMDGATRLSNRIDVTHFFEPEPGIILPKEVEWTQWASVDAKPKLKEGFTRMDFYKMSEEEKSRYVEGWDYGWSEKVRCVFTEAIINKGIPKEDFTIKFPKGARIWDEFTDLSYIVSDLPGSDE